LNHAFIETMKFSRFRSFTSTCAAGACLACVTPPALWAQNGAMPSVDAGSLTQQNAQSIKQHLPASDTLRLLSLPPPMALSDQLRMNVRRVYFLGNRRLDKAQLYPAVLPFLNRPLTSIEIGRLTAAVTDIYRQAGWIVEVYVPQQALDQNELTLQVVEDIRNSGKPAR
jgi:hemolysin activation/secretion protein